MDPLVDRRFCFPESAKDVLNQNDVQARANELLTEAGYSQDNPVELKLRYNTSESHKALGIAVQQFLRPLGIKIALTNVEAKVAEDPTQLYAQAEEILAEEVPAAFVYHYTTALMINPKIKGYATENVGQNWYAEDMYRLAD